MSVLVRAESTVFQGWIKNSLKGSIDTFLHLPWTLIFKTSQQYKITLQWKQLPASEQEWMEKLWSVLREVFWITVGWSAMQAGAASLRTAARAEHRGCESRANWMSLSPH